MQRFNINSEKSKYLVLILEDLEGSISAQDADQLKRWRLENPDNNSFYKEIAELQGDLELLQLYKKLKPEESLEALHKKLDFNQSGKIERGKKIRNIQFKRWIGIAASFLIVSFIALYFTKNKDLVSLKTGDGTQKSYTLPDGTKIYLNANTEVNYSKSKFNNSRKLKLIKGECFLNVVHNPAKAFSIQHSDLEVTDIGTSFNIKENQHQIAVAVNSGQVKLHVKGKATETILNPGEEGFYGLADKTVRKDRIQDPNYKAYTDRNISFNNTSLPLVAKTLESVYHKKIVIQSNDLKTRKFTGGFRNQRLKDVLLVLTETLQINMNIKKGVIYLESRN